MAEVTIARIKVTLRDIRPPIWRRIEVPLQLTFRDLSDVILAAFGWTNSHLHEFEIGRRHQPGQRRIGMPEAFEEDDFFAPPDDVELAEIFPGLPLGQARLLVDPPLEDERLVTLAEALNQQIKRFTYTYDFGDNWRHDLLIEALLPDAPQTAYPRVVAGRRAAPPEDCGGVWGYEQLCEVLADPSHEEYAELRDWCPHFAPEQFDLDAVDEAVRQPLDRE